MKKPILTQEERFNYNQDNLSGSLLRLFMAYKYYERSMYKKYGFIAWFLIKFEIKELLKPINKQINNNWIKSNGRYT